MSSESGVRIPAAVNPRFPGRGSSPRGQSGAKARPGGVADAQRADIPAPPRPGLTDGVTEEGGRTGFWTSPRWRVGRQGGKSPCHVPEAPDEAFLAKPVSPRSLEKRLGTGEVPVPKPTQVGG